jgi:hypothetical protein
MDPMINAGRNSEPFHFTNGRLKFWLPKKGRGIPGFVVYICIDPLLRCRVVRVTYWFVFLYLIGISLCLAQEHQAL